MNHNTVLQVDIPDTLATLPATFVYRFRRCFEDVGGGSEKRNLSMMMHVCKSLRSRGSSDAGKVSCIPNDRHHHVGFR